MASELLELASRVEGLTGPDREADAEIYALHFNEPCTWAKTMHGGVSSIVPRYTGSVDAAMTLAASWQMPHIRFDPDEMKWHCQMENGIGLPFKGQAAHAATPALALCAAALRSRRHSGETAK